MTDLVMNSSCLILLALVAAMMLPGIAEEITFFSLLEEMADRSAITSFPEVEYRSLQASSYNRESVPPRGSSGWFADSDGTGFLRKERGLEGAEWVIMEHDGPGCITRMWTPYFYYDLKEHRGPRIRVYLDGERQPAIEEYFIELLTQGEFRGAPKKKNDLQVPLPFAAYTARAGDLYLPIPFAKSCKITLDEKPFYYIINYRAYPEGTNVRSWTRSEFDTSRDLLSKIGAALTEASNEEDGIESRLNETIAPGGEAALSLPGGSNAVHLLEIRLGPDTNPQRLRSTILRMECDGVETIWTPVGDFFCSGNAINPLNTWEREVDADGTMTCRWQMPYRAEAGITVRNLGPEAVQARLRVRTRPREWTDASMYFHACWRIDEPVPGTPFQDWNFIDIRGKGVYVGDQWTVLCADEGWWGEGDEKIYVDSQYDTEKFPAHFGTGTEDYYGWAGGEVPTGADAFSMPFLSNVRVGNAANPRGYNICTRSRVLDAIPFHTRLHFDMEASFGVQMRNPWDLLQYAVVTYWYALPGAGHNRPPQPDEAARPAMTVEELEQRQDQLRGK